MAFRPYTDQEIQDAAEAYGVDPRVAKAFYEVESSSGTDPGAMTVRKIERKKGGPTFVRGPFQLTDSTTEDLLQRQGLKNVDLNNPDVHLDIAMRLIRELQDRYNGDPVKIAQGFFGHGTDELGTTTGSYTDRFMAAYRKHGGEVPATTASAVPTASDLFASAPIGGGDGGGAMPADALFGIPAMPAPDQRPMMPTGMAADLSKLAQVPRDPLGLPMNITAATTPHPLQAPNTDFDQWIQKLVDEELQGRDYATTG